MTEATPLSVLQSRRSLLLDVNVSVKDVMSSLKEYLAHSKFSDANFDQDQADEVTTLILKLDRYDEKLDEMLDELDGEIHAASEA